MTPLSVVMPVYNEAGAIEPVVAEWISTLESLGIVYEFIVLDDGSTDETGAVLDGLAARMPALRVLHHDNRGHGPTILGGYGLTRGDWVLQIDSDGEIAPDRFRDLWRVRESHDFLIGLRTHRSVPLVRRIVSAVSRTSVHLLFGQGIHDVNVPFRLMRGPWLRELVRTMPEDLFAPNVILSGLAIRRGLRIREIPVEHVGRRHGHASLGRLSVLRPAALSLWQTLIASRGYRDESGRTPGV